MYQFDQCDVVINGSGIIAEFASLRQQNSLIPVYPIGKRGCASIAPAGPLTTQIQFDYVVETNNEPNYNLVGVLKDFPEELGWTGVTIEIVGVTGFNCHLESYKLRSEPNALVKASVSYITFEQVSGVVSPKKGTITYNDKNAIANSWSVFITTTSGYLTTASNSFNYSFDAKWEPIYTIGKTTPVKVGYMGAVERMNFVKDNFIKILFSGENAHGGVVDSGSYDGIIDVYNLSFLRHDKNRAIRFAAIGDYGQSGANLEIVADLVKSFNPEFIITLGDNNYDYGDSTTIEANVGQYFGDYIYPYSGPYHTQPQTNRFFPAIGNHDATGNVVTPSYANNYAPYLNYFSLSGNERYYTYTRGDVQFFVLNSDQNEPDGYTSTSPQAQWLQNGLNSSRSLWKFVYFHHSPYSSENGYSSFWMRWPFKEWGADVVLAGHAHEYERIDVSGLTYFVNGIGGKSLRNFGTIIPESKLQYNSGYGAMIIDVYFDKAIFELYSNGGIRDRHVIYKNFSGLTCDGLMFDMSGAKIVNSDLSIRIDDYLKNGVEIVNYY